MSQHNLTSINSLSNERDKDTKLNHFLQAVPYLTFSDKGLENIAKRFGISVEQLKQHISEFMAKEGRYNGGA